MKKSILFLALPLLCLAASSCHRESLPVPDSGTGRGPILFTAAPLFQPSVSTKTEAVTALQSFYVGCVTGVLGTSETEVWNAAFTSNGAATPTYSGDKYWPLEDAEYKFYASNAVLTTSGTGYTVSATNTQDVVCAVLGDPDYACKNALTFEHIFARLGDVTVTAASGYTISDVSIRITPKTGGTYSLYAGNGQTDGTGWSALTTGSATEIANSTPGTKANDLYLVPGTYTLTATWTATRGEYTETFTDRQSDVELVAGRSNAITSTLAGDATNLACGVSLTAWDSGSNAVSFSLRDPVPYEGADFGGIMIAPAPLYYDGNAFVIKDDDWNHDSFNSLYGKVEGSYFFDYMELASFFDSHGAAYQITGDPIDYGSGNKVSYGGFDDWRLPTFDEWQLLMNAFDDGGTSQPNANCRSGSTVNGEAGKKYARLTLTGVTHAGSSTPSGVLILPEGKTLTASRSFVWNSGFYNTGNTNTDVTASQLQEYLDQGCIFIPASGAFSTQNNGSITYGWQQGGVIGYYWSNTYKSEKSYIWCAKAAFYASDSVDRYKDKWKLSVRLVRSIN